jgi:hypothetical protein
VLASFVPISLFAGRSPVREREPYPRFDLLWIGPLRVVITARAFLGGVQLFSVAIFFLVIISGLLGRLRTTTSRRLSSG